MWRLQRDSLQSADCANYVPTPGNGLRVAVDVSGRLRDLGTDMDGSPREPLWAELGTVPRYGVTTLRVQAVDLRQARRLVDLARPAAPGREVSVLVEVEAVVAEDVRTATRALADLPRISSSLRYVGTTTGLLGLVRDITTLRIADGVALVPLLEDAERLIFAEVPKLLGG
jgi:hypothetical protein